MRSACVGVLGGVALLAVALLLAVTAMSGADSATDEGVARGAAHVEATCSGCHPGAQLDALLRARLGGDDVSALDSFLKSHHAADDALRAGVLAHLKARLASSAGE